MMKESKRNTLFWVFSVLIVAVLGALILLIMLRGGFREFFKTDGAIQYRNIIVGIAFVLMLALFGNELFHWRKHGKRSEAFDLVLIGFIFTGYTYLFPLYF